RTSVEKVVLHRVGMGAGAIVEVLLEVALQGLQAVDGLRLIRHGKIREDQERPGSDLVPGWDERPPLVRECSAARCGQNHCQQQELTKAAEAANRLLIDSALQRKGSPRVRTTAVRCGHCGISCVQSRVRLRASGSSSR